MTTEETNQTEANLNSTPNPYNIKIHGWLKVFLVLLLGLGVMGVAISWIRLKGANLDYDSPFGYYTVLFQTLISLVVICYIVHAFFKVRCNAVFMGKAFALVNLILDVVIVLFSFLTIHSIYKIAGSSLVLLYLTYSKQVNDIFPKGFRKALKRDYYIIAAYFLFPILFFFACLIQLGYEEKKEWERITSEDLEQVINTLSLYQLPEDYLYIQSELAKILEDNEISPEEDLDFFYLNNILHIDSVIYQGIELAKQNKAKELVHLLEKERGNFYAHPNNTIDNEIDLISLFAMLYSKTEKNEMGYHSKLVPLLEFAYAHIKALQTWNGEEIHPYYPKISFNLLKLYAYTNDNAKAIEIAKELCDYYEQLNDTTQYINLLTILSQLYDNAGMTNQHDSCQNILEVSPIYQEFLKLLEEKNDTTKSIN